MGLPAGQRWETTVSHYQSLQAQQPPSGSRWHNTRDPSVRPEMVERTHAMPLAILVLPCEYSVHHAGITPTMCPPRW